MRPHVHVPHFPRRFRFTTPAATPFSITDAAFSGYGLIRDHWRSVMAWAAIKFGVNLVQAFVIVLLAGKTVGKLSDAAQALPQDAGALAQVMSLFQHLEPVALFTLPVGFFLQTLLLAAVYRAYLHPDQSRWGYLRLGREEWVIALVTVLWWLLYFACVAAVTFVLVLITSVAQTVSPLLASLWAVLGVLAAGCLLVWGLVRSSLAWVDSFDRRKVSLFHSLKVTRGHFWPMLIAYLLALCIMAVAAVVLLIAFVLLASVAALASGQGLDSVHAAVFDPDRSSLAGYFTVATVCYLAFTAVTGAASYAALFGPSADAYLAFREKRAEAAETFA